MWCSVTNCTHVVNESCPFKVVGEDGKDSSDATGWLNCLWERAVPSSMRPPPPGSALRAVWDALRELPSRDMEDVASAAEAVGKEIVRSIPLTPIAIGEHGEQMVELPPKGLGQFVDHAKDSDTFVANHDVGIHEVCGGIVKRVPISLTHDALVCGRCSLRTPFLNKVKTYGELRRRLGRSLMLPISF